MEWMKTGLAVIIAVLVSYCILHTILLSTNSNLPVMQSIMKPSEINLKMALTNVKNKTSTKSLNRKPNGSTLKLLIWHRQHVINTAFPLGKTVYQKCELPEGSLCENVIDRRLYDQSDAILFHGKALSPKSMPNHRLPHHKWIFFEFETPPNTWANVNIKPLMKAFNLTTTYNPDSDIPMKRYLPVCSVDNGKLLGLQKKNINYAEGKTGKVAWFVSHCKTQSKREIYARELSKYISVDIYGKCGKFHCGNSAHLSNCDKSVIDKKYKFYLSFENSICPSLNYVTEKLWRIMSKPISAIPVVLGGVNYKKMFPNDTFIDVLDFPEPKALAEYLLKIDADDDKFNDMINRKNALVCAKSDGSRDLPLYCKICQYLHKHHNKTQIIPNIVDSYSTAKLCVNPRIYYKWSLKGT